MKYPPVTNFLPPSESILLKRIKRNKRFALLYYHIAREFNSGNTLLAISDMVSVLGRTIARPDLYVMVKDMVAMEYLSYEIKTVSNKPRRAITLKNHDFMNYVEDALKIVEKAEFK